MMIRRLILALTALAATIGAAAQSAPPPDRAVAILDRIARIDELPRYRDDIATIGIFSSYDRTGGNDDGFEGTHSFIRRQADGGLVIAEMTGPGAVTRIWTPTPSDDQVEFYFDGERTPRLRLKFSDLFSGDAFPFLAPVVGRGAGGFYSYAPLVYRRSLKVVVRAAKFYFYQINYETYRDSAGVASFRPVGDAGLRAALARAGATLATSGVGFAPVGDRHRASGTLASNGRATLFVSDRPGRITELRLGPREILAGPARDLTVNVYYDGEAIPSISVPAGDLFGHAWGEPAMRSLLIGDDVDGGYLRFPMPYDRGVRVELASDRAAPVMWRAEVVAADVGRRPDEARFYAFWQRENPTTRGRPFTFVDARGRGHLVGAILQAQGDAPGAIPEFFEGDDETTIDGTLRIRGTGSEDFFNGGWYDVPGRWDARVSLPLSGSLGFERALARTGGYRLLLSDAYPFARSLTQTIEHGPSGNALTTDYTALTFLYADRPPVTGPLLPPLATRAVVQPRELVYTPGWTTPVAAFSWRNATLRKSDDAIGGKKLRHLQFRATGEDVFVTHYLAFDCAAAEAGRYDIYLQAIAGPTQGRVQLFRDEIAVGPVAELYAPSRRKTGELPVGRLTLERGGNRLLFKLVGKDARASGFGFDVYRIVLRKAG